MTDREAMKQALEALERVMSHGPAVQEAKDILRSRLAQPEQEPLQFKCTVIDDAHPNGVPLEKWGKQPEQEPVAFEEWLSKQHGDPEEIGFLQALRIAYISGQDSITTPFQRTWVGLTDEEKAEIWANNETAMVVTATEAKLKEKNA